MIVFLVSREHHACNHEFFFSGEKTFGAGKDEISRFKFWSESLSSASISTLQSSRLLILYKLKCNVSRIDRACVILRRDRESSHLWNYSDIAEFSSRRARGKINFRRTGVDSKPVSRTLAVFHYPLVMTVVPYRTVITDPILDNTVPWGEGKKISSRFLSSFFFFISTVTPASSSTVSRIFKKERRDSLKTETDFMKKKKRKEKRESSRRKNRSNSNRN